LTERHGVEAVPGFPNHRDISTILEGGALEQGTHSFAKDSMAVRKHHLDD
jgi:hypothetical protein